MEIVGIAKAAYYTILSWLTSMLLYFFPIEGLVIAISIAFVANFSFGILTGVIVQRENICIKKALVAFIEVAIYLVILTCFFTIGDKMKGSMPVFQALSILTWAWIYFYSSNLSKNLKRLFPKSRGFSFLFYVLNLEFLKQVPYLKKFEENEKKEHSC